jgi:hypothetical protein
MAFKADSDGPRSSLRYELKRLFGFCAGAVWTVYRDLDVSGKTAVDIWNVWAEAFTGTGARANYLAQH